MISSICLIFIIFLSTFSTTTKHFVTIPQNVLISNSANVCALRNSGLAMGGQAVHNVVEYLTKYQVTLKYWKKCLLCTKDYIYTIYLIYTIPENPFRSIYFWRKAPNDDTYTLKYPKIPMYLKTLAIPWHLFTILFLSATFCLIT